MTVATRTAAVRPDRDPGPRLPPRRRDAAAERDADRVGRFGARAPRGHRAIRRGRGGRSLDAAGARPGPSRGSASTSTPCGSTTTPRPTRRPASATPRAVATGGDVLFARGAFRPGTPDGRELLLHELAHLAQQADGAAATQHQDAAADGPAASAARRPTPSTRSATTRRPRPRISPFSSRTTTSRPTKGFRGRFEAQLRTRTGPVLVRIHGYASSEGDPAYNVNLSAHRAVAARQAILDLLPAGSRVELVAHGETGAFGEPPGNRRAGVTIAALPTGVTLDADRWLREHPHVLLGEGLRLEPLPRPVINWEISDPGSLVRRPSAIDLTPAPLPYVSGRVPWGVLSEDFRVRGLTLGAGDQALILRHWQTWYPLARALEGRNPLSFGPQTADDWMTTFTRKMLSNALSGDRPNAVEAFDQDLKRRGIETPIYFPPLELSF